MQRCKKKIYMFWFVEFNKYSKPESLDEVTKTVSQILQLLRCKERTCIFRLLILICSVRAALKYAVQLHFVLFRKIAAFSSLRHLVFVSEASLWSNIRALPPTWATCFLHPPTWMTNPCCIRQKLQRSCPHSTHALYRPEWACKRRWRKTRMR